MRKVQIINGAYGYRPVGGKYPIPVSAGMPPIEVTDEEAKRLVDLKIAKYSETTLVKEDAETLATTTPPPVRDEPEYNIGMKAQDLRKLMEENGLAVRINMSKLEMVNALNEMSLEEDTGETPPDLGADAPIV